MKNSSHPPLITRLSSVWYRHYRVYCKNLFSNGFPPFLEPLIFLAGIGLGLGKYIVSMDGIPYIQFLATGLLVSTAMFTSAFECSFGTFIRLEFEKVYNAMLAAPITVSNLFVGEILWAGTKGFFFSLAVLLIMLVFGVIPFSTSIFAPFVGFITGVMFAVVSLFVTSFVKDINHLNFYFTGFLSPMFFFSGAVFPIQNLPPYLRPFCEIFPLTHVVRMVRALCRTNFSPYLLLDLLYCCLVILILGFFAVKRLEKRLIN
ncbi:MAG: ABC transporter permease [Fibrobacteria bacterium]|nr:ABC transporter permease [Fibrobacteria bacterium]